MNYPLTMDCAAADGTRLGVVYLPHEPMDAAKIVTLRAAMLRDGWQGRPVVMFDAGDHHVALSGVHRLSAAQGIDGLVEVVWLPATLSEEDYDGLDHASDDDDKLAWAQERVGIDGMLDVITTLRAEIGAH